MSNPNDNWGYKDIIGGAIGGTLFALVGLKMLINPNARDDKAAETTKIIGKLLDVIWGIPGGIILMLIGFAIAWISISMLLKRFEK